MPRLLRTKTQAALLTSLILLGVGQSLPRAHAADEFIRNLRKGDLRHEPDERIEYYSRAIRAWKPSHSSSLLAHCLFKRGEAYFDSFDFDVAMADLTEALDKDPGTARAYFLRGRILLFQGMPAKADPDLREFTALKPKDVDGRLAMAGCRLERKRFDSASEEYKLASELAPDDFRPWLGLARVQRARGQCLKAASHLEKADALAAHRSPRVLALRGECRHRLGYTKQGLKDLGESISLFETRLTDLQRSMARRMAYEVAKGRLSKTYDARGDIHLSIQEPSPALADYRPSCNLDYRPACLKAERLALKFHGEKDPEPIKTKKPKPKKKKRKRYNKPDNDPGERIYGF